MGRQDTDIASNLGEVVVRFTADTAGLNQGIANSVSRLQNFGQVIGAIGVAAIASFLVIGAESAKMAGNFQVGINRLRTGAGDVTDSFAMLSTGIQNVAASTGVLTTPLTNAMYLILSSGQRGAQAMDTLSIAAKGAVIEQANVVDVANTLSGVMTNYGTKLFTATDYMNGLIKAVSIGKITLQDLATAMGPIDPIARSVGVSFSDLSAAMTTQTNAMVPATRAATGLRFMMLALENPTKKAQDAMASFGLSSVQVADEMRVSLPGALQMIYDAAKRAGPEGSDPFNRAISDMVGGIRSFTTYTALTGPHMQAFIDNANKIAAAMKTGSEQVQGWTIAQGNFNTKMNEAHAALDNVAINIGLKMLPYLDQLLQKLTPLIQAFSNWLTRTDAINKIMSTLGTILGDVGTTLGTIWAVIGPIIVGFGTWAVQSGALNTTLSLLGTTFHIVLGAVLGLVQLGANFVGWLTNASPPAQILRNALIGLGIAILALKIPGLILNILQLGVTLSGMAAGAIASVTTMGASFTTMFGLMTGAIGTNIAAIGTETVTLGGMGVAVLGVLGPFALLAGAIAGLVALINGGALQSLNTMTQQMGGNLTPSVNALANQIAKDNHTVADSATSSATQVKSAMQQMEDAYSAMAVTAFNSSQTTLANQKITDALLLQEWTKTGLDAQGIMTKSGADSITWWKVVNKAAVDGTAQQYTTVKNGYQIVTDQIAAKMQQIKNAVQQKWQETNDVTLQQVTRTQIIVRTGFQAVADSITAKMQQSKDAVNQKWNEINAILNKQLKLHVDNTDAINAVRTFESIINGLPTTHTTYINSVVTPIQGLNTLPYHATGLFNNPFGHMAVVGERGPEVMWVPKGASIFPNSVAPALSGMGGAAGANQPIVVYVMIDGQQIGQYAGQRIANGIRVGTGIKR